MSKKALSTPIEKLRLSTRVRRCLESNDCLYLGDIVDQTKIDLLRMPGMGSVGIEEIKAMLKEYGWRLKADEPRRPYQQVEGKVIRLRS